MKTFKNLDMQSRQDADETAFFLRELEHIKAKTHDIVFPELKARVVIPVSFEAGSEAEAITYQQFEQTGFAKLISNYAADLPRVDILGREFSQKVKSIGDSYGFSVQEIRAAAKTGRNINQKKSRAARRAQMSKENNLAFFGDSGAGFLGFLNHPNVSITTIPNDGTGSSTEWINKTPDQVLRDMNLLFRAIFSVSKGVEFGNTLLLPLEQHSLIFDTPRASGSDMSIGKWFLENNPHAESIDWLNELEGAGAGSTDRMMAYHRNPDKVTMEVPQDYEEFPAQERGLEMIIPAHSRYGGILFYYPLSASYGDGI